MATLLSALETQARRHLLETTAAFWTSAELIDICNRGIKDLWGSLVDLHQWHYFITDPTHVSQPADTATLSGVPTDVFRVLLIEPRDVSSGATGRNLQYLPRDYHSAECIAARSIEAGTAGETPVIFYSVTQAGAPVGAPVIYVQPQLSGALNLTLTYIPIQGDVVAGQPNPIPGESDQALVAWIVAYARAKEREDRSPDPNWFAVYGTEKQNLMVRLTPRQEQEPEYIHGQFEGFHL